MPPWPDNKRACISITLDNMGEAADLHRGNPLPGPIGTHHSVTTQLPLLLSLLSTLDLKATYFIEAWNLTHYTPTIRSLLAAGHELAFHAWQHEVWSALDPATETRNLDRSVRAARETLGAQYKGFRPPGGLPTDRTLALLRERGFTYFSPAAERCAVVDGVAMVPFRWGDIDAYYYMESTGTLRAARGDGEGVVAPEVMKERLVRRVDEVLREGGYLALLFHPFLTVGEERHRVVREVLEYVKEREDVLWVAQCSDVADWVLGHAADFGDDPGLDMAQWKTK